VANASSALIRGACGPVPSDGQPLGERRSLHRGLSRCCYTCNAAHRATSHHPRQEFPLQPPTRPCLRLPADFLNPIRKQGLNVGATKVEPGLPVPPWEHGLVAETEQGVRAPDFHSDFSDFRWGLKAKSAGSQPGFQSRCNCQSPQLSVPQFPHAEEEE